MEIGDRLFSKSKLIYHPKRSLKKIWSNPNFRLINPLNSKIGKASKFLIENINPKVRELSSVNQCQDSEAVISWFKKIKNKSKCIIMKFDIIFLVLKICYLQKSITQKVLLISAVIKQPLCTQENLFFSVVQMCG